MRRSILGALCAMLFAPAVQAEVIDVYHPAKEPAGLYIATMHLGDSYYVEKTYRIYCPTMTVRDITGGKWKQSATVAEADKLIFDGAGYLTHDVNEVCGKKQTKAASSKEEPVFPACKNPETTTDMIECANQEIKYYDDLLNRNYKKLMDSLPQSEKETLKQAQRAWMAFRDAECDFGTWPMRDGSGEMVLYGACIAAETKERANELKQHQDIIH